MILRYWLAALSATGCLITAQLITPYYRNISRQNPQIDHLEGGERYGETAMATMATKGLADSLSLYVNTVLLLAVNQGDMKEEEKESIGLLASSLIRTIPQHLSLSHDTVLVISQYCRDIQRVVGPSCREKGRCTNDDTTIIINFILHRILDIENAKNINDQKRSELFDEFLDLTNGKAKNGSAGVISDDDIRAMLEGPSNH
eukprot:Ihof_evm2s440 gene=Ihof_evmTU2s440